MNSHFLLEMSLFSCSKILLRRDKVCLVSGVLDEEYFSTAICRL